MLVSRRAEVVNHGLCRSKPLPPGYNNRMNAPEPSRRPDDNADWLRLAGLSRKIASLYAVEERLSADERLERSEWAERMAVQFERRASGDQP